MGILDAIFGKKEHKPKKALVPPRKDSRVSNISSTRYWETELEGHLRVMDDCAQIMNSTTNIDTFFFRYDRLIDRFRMIDEMEIPFEQGSLTPKKAVEQIRNHCSDDINAFIVRCYTKAGNSGAVSSSFFWQFDKYKERLFYDNTVLLRKLYKESKCKDKDCWKMLIDLGAYTSNQDRLRSYREIGIEYYTFSCYKNIEPCPVCKAMEGKTFKVSEAVIGVNCPPLHSGCGCFIAPYRAGGTPR